MPQAVAGFIAKVGFAIFSGLTAIGIPSSVAIFILDTGIKLAALAFLNSVYTKLAGKPEFAVSAQSITITTRGTLEHQRIIYGETLVSGMLWYLNAAGTHNQALYHAIVLAGHEINNITDVWLDDNEIPEGYINWVGDGGVNSGDFRGNTAEQTAAYFDRFLGGPNQGASQDLQSAFSEIQSYHNGKYVAWALSRFDYFDGQTQVWSKGAPTNIRYKVQGKLVYDPRLDSTQSFGSGSHRLTNSLTWGYSDNPALCWADYMIDSRLGFGEDYTRVNYGYVASAAEICEGVVFTPVGTDNRFRANGVLNTGDTYEDNIRKILSAMNGSTAFINGEWQVRAWAVQTPTLSFDEDDLRDDIQIRLHPDEDARYNTVRGYFIDKDRRYKALQFPSATSSEYLARDNSEKLYRDVEMHMTNDIFMAQRLAFGILEQSDLETTVIYPTNYKTIPANIGGTIQVSNDKMDWSNKWFRVQRYKFSDLGGIDLVLREDDSSAYTDVGTDEYSVNSEGTYVVAGIDVPPVNSLWVLARQDGNLIQWNAPPARLSESVRLYVSQDSNWNNVEELADIRGTSYLHQYHTPKPYYYWSRVVDYTGALSAVIPDSGSSGVAAFPGLINGRIDYTFDLSNDIEDFYDEVEGNGSWTLSTSGGENGEHAALANVVHFNSDAELRLKTNLPIAGDTLRIRTRYRVESWYGTSAGSQYLELGARGYYPTPVSSTFDKFQQTDPSTYTVGNEVKVAILPSSITQTGSWATIQVDVDVSNIVNSGDTFIRPIIRWQSSSTISVNANTRALHNNFIFYWV